MLGHNLYAYCNNTPVNLSDEIGDFAIETIGAICAVVIAVLYVLSQSENNSEIGSGIVQDLIDTGTQINDDIKQGFNNTKKKIFTKVSTSIKNKTKTNIKSKTNNEKVQYFADTDKAIKTIPLSYSQAKSIVAMGGNIVCANQIAAYAIAKWYPNRKLDKPHGIDFYYHYHINSKLHGAPHIWFEGPKIFDY